MRKKIARNSSWAREQAQEKTIAPFGRTILQANQTYMLLVLIFLNTSFGDPDSSTICWSVNRILELRNWSRALTTSLIELRFRRDRRTWWLAKIVRMPSQGRIPLSGRPWNLSDLSADHRPRNGTMHNQTMMAGGGNLARHRLAWTKLRHHVIDKGFH